jgi:hypothetical protein
MNGDRRLEGLERMALGLHIENFDHEFDSIDEAVLPVSLTVDLGAKETSRETQRLNGGLLLFLLALVFFAAIYLKSGRKVEEH